jgi:putative thioredoxin
MDSITPTSPPQPQPVSSDPVKVVTVANFMAEVMDASRQRPVIVDFWAPWCGPCKQLGPVLEKLVRAQKGAIHLAKIDIDREPEIVRQLRVQSIPAVFAFFKGQPVDGFMGALPEPQIKAWLERLLKATGSSPQDDATIETETALKQATELLEKDDAAGAQAIYAEILEKDPTNAAAKAGSQRCLQALELAEQAQMAAGSLAELQIKVQQNPGDHQARFDLALAYYGAGQREQAVEALLESVRRNRKWNDEAARKQLLKMFEAFGPVDPLTIQSRKRLSSILFA